MLLIWLYFSSLVLIVGAELIIVRSRPSGERQLDDISLARTTSRRLVTAPRARGWRKTGRKPPSINDLQPIAENRPGLARILLNQADEIFVPSRRSAAAKTYSQPTLKEIG